MLVCAHPAIAANVRTPLMLQTVLGVDAAAIAAAFAVEPATMAQRLVRAKKRIRDAGIPFRLPEREDLAERLPAVLEAVYGAYAIDWQLAPLGAPIEIAVRRGAAPGAGAGRTAARRARGARAGGAGVSVGGASAGAARRRRRFVPLDEQDTALWDSTLIARGENLLRRAHAFRRPGRFQYEAAIQSAHCTRPVDTSALVKLHRAVARLAPSLGALVALAAVDGEVDGPDVGLRALDAIDDPAAARFQPALVTRAHLLARAGRNEAAVVAYRAAIQQTTDPGIVEYLRKQLTSLTG